MSSSFPEAATAQVRIEVPHWLASVSLLDNDLKPVAFDARITQVPDEPFLGRLDVALPPGPYQVNVTIDGKSQSKWVVAEANAHATLAAETWTELKLDSSLPMPASAPATMANDRYARIASMSVPRGAQAGARLGLFGTAIVPCSQTEASQTPAPNICLAEQDAPRDFDFDMTILDEHGETVVSLADSSVRRYVAPRQLWRCFLDLEPGAYVLRSRVPAPRAASEAPLRYRLQPLFLCPGLDHHLFFRCDGPADLTTLTMHVTHIGQGYDPLRTEAVAADGVLTALANGQAQQLLLGSATLGHLLEGEIANPWLGVLAAYGLGSGPLEPHIQAQIDDIVAYLERGPLRHHPDVQLLLLRDDDPGPALLRYPPMLLAAMRRLQRMAVERAGLIAPESLLDRLPSRLAADTAWTAWIEEATPAPAPPSAPAAGERAPADDAPTSSLPTPIAAFVEAFPDSAPVFPLTAVEPLPADEAVRQNATIADHAAIIEAATAALDDVCRTGTSEVEVSFNATAARSLLDLSPEDVSRLTGAPLDQTVKDLELLRTTQASLADAAALERPMQLLAAAILGKQAQASVQHLDEGEPPSPPSPIETQARRLADDVERLSKVVTTRGGDVVAALAPITARFEAYAASLLKRAHLVILADERGRLRYGNRLLRDRLEERQEGAAAVLARMARVFDKQKKHLVVVDAAELSPNSPEGQAHARVEIRRSLLSDGSQTIGAIYLLRDLTYPELSRAAARQIDALLPLITLSASMLEFAELEEQAGYVDELQRIADQLGALVLDGVTQQA